MEKWILKMVAICIVGILMVNNGELVLVDDMSDEYLLMELGEEN